MTTAGSGLPAVFLDRDGTIIDEVGYLDRPDRIELYPFTRTAIRALNRAGIPVFMVTNQSGIARGFFDEAMLGRIHARLADMLAEGGAHLDAYYFCPHHPDGKLDVYRGPCGCRKPAGGMIERAVSEFGIDPTRSFTVGDRWLDVQLGQRVGGRGILVKTGYGSIEAANPGKVVADAVVDNLVAAVGHILAAYERERTTGA